MYINFLFWFWVCFKTETCSFTCPCRVFSGITAVSAPRWWWWWCEGIKPALARTSGSGDRYSVSQSVGAKPGYAHSVQRTHARKDGLSYKLDAHTDTPVRNISVNIYLTKICEENSVKYTQWQNHWNKMENYKEKGIFFLFLSQLHYCKVYMKTSN